MLGEAQGLEWGETPTWIHPLAQLGLLLVAVNFLSPIIQTRGPMYVTLWYFTAAFIWTFLTYAMGKFIPIPSTTSASATRCWPCGLHYCDRFPSVAQALTLCRFDSFSMSARRTQRPSIF